jgi:hypothetical protein
MSRRSWADKYVLDPRQLTLIIDQITKTGLTTTFEWANQQNRYSS